MTSENNAASQCNEIEVLTSIYGDRFCADAGTEPISYSFDVHPDVVCDWPENNFIHFCFTFPPDYPSESPPKFVLSAPWLDLSIRTRLTHELNDVYAEHIGESVVYPWIEHLREFMNNFVSSSMPRQRARNSGSESSAGAAATNNNSFYNDDDECPPIFPGEPFSDRKSTFQAHVAPVVTKEEVTVVLTKLKENKKIAAATHNIYAYRIVSGNIVIADCEDDGEHHAGKKLLTLLDHGHAENVLVVVTRWYGGIHLGPDRFHHINERARILLQQEGYLPKKDEKSAGGKKKKR